MKYTGCMTELGIEIDHFNFEVEDAVVTRDRIAMDWQENEVRHHAVLKSNDGTNFIGNFGAAVPKTEWKIQGKKYTAADKSMVLLLRWTQEDFGRAGWVVVELDPVNH
jgi:hypothetical protein